MNLTLAQVDSDRAGSRGTCPFCRRRLSLVNPRRGDGSGRRFLPHGPKGDRCAGSWELIV